MTRRSDPHVDEVAVARCAAGELHPRNLTVEELIEVIHHLEPWANDAELGRRIGVGITFVAKFRREKDIPRRSPPPGPDPWGKNECHRILGYRRGPRHRVSA